MKSSLFLLAAAAAVVQASPFPQGVTAKISPTAPAPPGCSGSYSGTFGIVVMNITMASGAQSVTAKTDGQPQATTKASSAPVSQITDGQPQASTGKASSAVPVSQISDGQPQATTAKVSVPAVSQISDGQPQAATSTMKMTMPAVTQIADGQVQATYKPVSQISDGQPQAPKPTATAVSQISDGQPQAPKSTAAPVSQITDGQPQAPKTTMVTKTSAAPVSQISDGQPQASTGKATSAVSQISDGQPQATKSGAAKSVATQMVACQGPGVLNLTLSNGVLLDSQGRTGYIAANYQFQFDKPAQTGAIYTSGFSVCGNGSLALGGSNIFYQCLSGNFYNLYDRSWAPQCTPITINVLMLEKCTS